MSPLLAVGGTIDRLDDLVHKRTLITLRCAHAMRERRFTAPELYVARPAWDEPLYVWARREIAGIEAEFGCPCWRTSIDSSNPKCVGCEPLCWYERLIRDLQPERQT